ncbi:hypothetical protein ABPG74_003448 [Tetrahymena malaccensis]
MSEENQRQDKRNQQGNDENHSLQVSFDHETNSNHTNTLSKNKQKFYDSSSNGLNQLQKREEDDADQIMETELRDVKIEQDQEKIQVRLLDILKKLKLRRFAQKLINSTRTRMLKNMTILQYNYLNDKSQNFYDLKNGQNSNSFKIFSTQQLLGKHFKRILKVIDQIPIINPASICKRFWDTLMAIVLLYSFFYIPILVSFGLDETMILMNYSIEIILTFNILDIFIHTNTGFYEHGILCKHKAQIRKKYYSFQFSVDLFSILPLILYKIVQVSSKVEIQYYQFFTLFIFIRWKSQIKIYNSLQQNYVLQPKVRDFLSLLDLFLKVLFIAHICACFWIFTGRTSQFIYGNSWIAKTQLLNESWQIQYLDSFYFCTVTMSTVGYGDIVPVTPLEIIVCILMMLFASGVFGFSITTINGILESFFKNENKILQKLFRIKNYLQKKSISQTLQRDITEYLEYVWREEKHNYQEEEKSMIKLLPNYLKNQLYEECNKLILKESPILQSNFSEDLLKAILPIIQERTFTPNQLIFELNKENLGTCIYFIQQGQVEKFLQQQESETQDKIQIKNSQKLLKVYKKGDYFGEIEFFTGKKLQINVKSVDFTTLLIINRNEFIEILKNFPQDLEQFCYIRDKIIFSNDYSKIFHSCYSCNSQKHTIIQCPYIHFTQNIQKVIAFYQRADNRDIVNETQQQIIRSEYKCKFTPLDLYRVCQQFQEENEESIDYYQQNYLQYSINICDQCSNLRFDQEKKMQIQNAQQVIYKGQDNVHGIQNNQNDQKYQIQKQQSYLNNQDDTKYQENEISNQGSSHSNQNSPDSFKLVSLQHIMNHGQSNLTDFDLQADFHLDSFHITSSLNNQYFAGSQNFTNKKRFSVDTCKLNNNQDFEKQHTLQQYFDIFFGAFEKLKCFSFYFPFDNYDLVIKQIYLSSEQKKIVQKKMLEKQMQRFSKMLNKRKKSVNISFNNNETKIRKSSIKIQENFKNHKSFLIQQNNSIFQNMNSFQQSIQNSLIQNKQFISQNQLEPKSHNQSIDNFDDSDTLKLKMQNQKINKECFSNNLENSIELDHQFNPIYCKQSNFNKINNSIVELSKFHDTSFQQRFNESMLLNMLSNKSMQNQKREEDYISSSPKIENKIMKFNISQIPCIDVFKYNNQQANNSD